MTSKEYDQQIFNADACPICSTFFKGNVCTRCGKTHEPNEHFYGSKSLHFHMVSAPHGTMQLPITGNLCENCYCEDMEELTGHRPIGQFQPHSR